MLSGIVRTILGWMFIFLGIIGIFLPILQGILFLVIGLMLLSTRYAFAQKLLHRAENRFPAEFARMQMMKGRLLSSRLMVTTGLVLLVGLCALGIYLAGSVLIQLVAGS